MLTSGYSRVETMLTRLPRVQIVLAMPRRGFQTSDAMSCASLRASVNKNGALFFKLTSFAKINLFQKYENIHFRTDPTSSPLSPKHCTQVIRQDSLIKRFDDLYASNRLNAMDILRNYSCDYENNQRIIFAVVQVSIWSCLGLFLLVFKL